MRPAARLIYLHGFRSSPASTKAQQIHQALVDIGQEHRFSCPQLPDAPDQAWSMLCDTVTPGEEDLLVGSSLGGFYAVALAEQFGCRAVLLNPAMDAPRLLAAQLGRHRRWHGPGTFEFGIADLESLRRIVPNRISRPERYLLIAATADEVIDWRTMTGALPGVRTIIIEGGDHALSDFEHHLPEVIHFAGLRPGPHAPALTIRKGS